MHNEDQKKQIEEMAKIVLQEPHVGGLYGFDERIALRLYNAGYRKSTELAEEIFAEIEETFKECLWFLENHPSDYPRMDRTKINVYKDNLQYIAEIKNKYKGE